MRFLFAAAVIGLVWAPAARSEENEEVTKLVRAALDAKRAEDRDALLEQLFARDDLDWAPVRKGLEEGPYHQKPMVTAYGERHSGKHFDLRYTAADNKPRGFSMWVPRSYDASKPLPLLFYLHHDPQHPQLVKGSEAAGLAMNRFRDVCEEHGFFFVAPYTAKGAEWWTPEGQGLVEWTLREVRRRYRIDDDRIALMGALGGGDAVWYLGQQMPGTWSCLMPMTGDPYEISGMIRPLYLGSLDRMDVLTGVGARTNSTVGVKNTNQFLDGLSPMVGQRMRVTAAVYPTSHGDFGYLEAIKPQVVAFVTGKKRNPFADEVDVESDVPVRSLWLRNDGYDAEGPEHPGFPTTLLKWTPPERRDPDKKVGLVLHPLRGSPVGLQVTSTTGAASKARIFPGDILLEIDGVPVAGTADVKPLVDKHEWNSEVRLLLAREMLVSRRKWAERVEERYRKVRAKIEELRAAGKPVPDDLGAAVEEEEPLDEPEDEDDDGGGIVISDDDDPVGPEKAEGGETEPTFFMLIERYVPVRKPLGPVVRADFGVARDPNHKEKGTRIASVYPGSLADRSGLREGDVIIQVGDRAVDNAHDIQAWFEDFRFEDEPEGENWVAFTVRRQEGHDNWKEHTVRVRWERPVASRVDARWDHRDNTLYVLARKASGFTIYFHDELIEPGKPFHLFINDVPYLDLVDPASAPDYPRVTMGSDNAVKDRLFQMRRERSKVEGWTPDVKWAVEQYLEHRDRRQAFGAFRSFDLTAMREGFAKAKARHAAHEGERVERVRKAYEEHEAKSQG